MLLAAACVHDVSAATPGASPAANDTRPAATSGTATSPPVERVYDNTLASEACTLLSPQEISAAFGGVLVSDPAPVDPFCQWLMGNGTWVSLQIYPDVDAKTFRKTWGAAYAAAAPVGDDGYFANNKALVFGDRGRTYVLGFEQSGVWDDKARPAQVAAAHKVIDRVHSGSPLPAPPPAVPPPPVDPKRTASDADPLRLWVGGDSLAGGPSWAIGDRLATTSNVRTYREFHVGTGLNRPDFFDWHRHLAAEVDAYRPEAMVLMFGGNDTQPFTVDGKGITIDDPQWAEIYRQRVAAVLDVTARDGRPVVWVGLPPMKDAKLSKGVARVNEIVAKEVAAHPGAVFVDVWAMFSAPGKPGVYTDSIADGSGKPRSVRLDGIHLNTDGSRVLADAVLPKLHEVAPAIPATGG